jgi:glutathione S-transferase
VTPTLYTIPISHYGERARWALDRGGVEYRESHHLQMFSCLYALALGGKKTLPILRTRDRVLNDSGDIMRWADPSLYPTDDVLDRELAGDFGDQTRRIAYGWFFRELERFWPINMGRAPRYEGVLLRAALPVGVAFLRRYLTVTPNAIVAAHDAVMRMFDRVAGVLGDRLYLFGDRFSAVDLTFATMSAPVIAPPQYGVPLPSVDELPEDARRVVAEFRAHPAGAYALRLYTERPPVSATY